MTRRLAPAVTSAAVAALAAGLLATALTGTAGAATTAAASTSSTPPASTTTAPAKDRGVLVAVPRNTGATASLSRCFTVGTVFSVSLYENLSTGYNWAQSVPATATGPVVLLDTDYVQDPGSGVGGGGTRYFRYRVTAPGTTAITFLYRRPWETGVPPLQQVTLAVRAR